MKKSILIVSLVFSFQMEIMAQQKIQFKQVALYKIATPGLSFSSDNNGPNKDANFYFHRSKNYRIVGWATLGGGAVLSGIGILLANGDYATNNDNSNTAGVLTVAGAVSGVVSIPFMIMASAYKHKAKAMISSQKTGFGVPANVGKDIVGVTMVFPLGK